MTAEQEQKKIRDRNTGLAAGGVVAVASAVTIGIARYYGLDLGPILLGGGILIAAVAGIGKYELDRGQHVVMKTGGEVDHTVIRASRFPWKFYVRGLQTPIYVDESPRLLAMREESENKGDDVIAAGQPIQIQFKGGGTADMSLGIKASIKNGADILARLGARRESVDLETEPELREHINTTAVMAAQVAAGQFTLSQYIDDVEGVTRSIDVMIRRAIQNDMDKLIISDAPGTANYSSKKRLAAIQDAEKRSEALFEKGARIGNSPKIHDQRVGWCMQQTAQTIAAGKARDQQDLAIVIHDAVAYIKLHEDVRESLDKVKGAELTMETWSRVAADPNLGLEALRIFHTNQTLLDVAQASPTSRITSLVGIGSAFNGNGGLKGADAVRMAGLDNDDDASAAGILPTEEGTEESAREMHERIKRQHLGRGR